LTGVNVETGAICGNIGSADVCGPYTIGLEFAVHEKELSA